MDKLAAGLFTLAVLLLLHVQPSSANVVCDRNVCDNRYTGCCGRIGFRYCCGYQRSKTAQIIGSVISALFLITLSILFCMWCRRRQAYSYNTQQPQQAAYGYSGEGPPTQGYPVYYPGYPPEGPGAPGQYPPPAGYPPQQGAGYPPPQGYPPQQVPYPPGGAPGYPPPPGAAYPPPPIDTATVGASPTAGAASSTGPPPPPKI